MYSKHEYKELHSQPGLYTICTAVNTNHMYWMYQ